MPVPSSIVALLSSVAVLIAGNGLLNTLVPMRGVLAGFPDLAIGLLGSAYFAGMLAGTLAAPAIIARCGFIRAFSALVSAAVVLALAFPLAVGPVAWVGLRYGIGFVFSGFYAIIEAWLTAKSDNRNRGRVYALYQVVTYGGTAAGQQILGVFDPRSATLFSVVAGAFALATVPLAFTRAEPPPRPRTVTLRLGWLVRTVPTASFAVFCIGAANGTFWALAPVYGLGLGLPPAGVATFMTAVILGTAAALYPVGRWSDGGDRRKVLVPLAAAAAVAEATLAALGAVPLPVLAGLGAAVGATAMVLYMLAISHANDVAGPDHAVTVSSGALFLYCSGAIAAPILASVLMARWGAGALFAQNAVTHLALAAVVLVSRRRAVPAGPRSREAGSDPAGARSARPLQRGAA